MSSLMFLSLNLLLFIITMILVALVSFNSLTKLMVSHDLPRSTVTRQISFERAMDRRCQALVPILETPDTITFT